MKHFDSVSAKGEFKNLCTEVFPAIKSIEQALAKAGVTGYTSIKVGDNGYMALDISDSKWRMARYEKDKLPRIYYEHSEEISIPQSRTFDKVSENLVEISLTYAKLQPEMDSQEIDSLTWKQEFVDWANEFEQMYRDVEWGTPETDGKEYLEAIEEFAKGKIRKFAGLEG